jgi:hypothetical protein
MRITVNYKDRIFDILLDDNDTILILKKQLEI